jgi:hypothetical protein
MKYPLHAEKMVLFSPIGMEGPDAGRVGLVRRVLEMLWSKYQVISHAVRLLLPYSILERCSCAHAKACEPRTGVPSAAC